MNTPFATFAGGGHESELAVEAASTLGYIYSRNAVGAISNLVQRGS